MDRTIELHGKDEAFSLISLFLKLITTLTGILALPIFLIQITSTGPQDLPAILRLASNCAVPCLLGVRPGVSTVNDAMQLLEQNAVATAYIIQADEFNVQLEGTRINWEYDVGTRRFRGSIYFEQGIAQRITIYDIPFGEVWLALGLPDNSSYVTDMVTDGAGRELPIPILHSEYYNAHYIRVDAPMTCATYWFELAQIHFIAETTRPTFGSFAAGDQPVSDRKQACAVMRRLPQHR